jgi:choline dehydrogenase-like flavoprotein
MQGTSRGGADIQEIVKRLSLWGVNMLFVGAGSCLLQSSRASPQHVLCTACSS